MVLYAADLINFEKPKPISQEVEKIEKVEKVKREMSEKQKASLLKAQETRRLKKEVAEKEKLETEALSQKLQEAALKKPRKKVKVEPEVKVEEAPKPKKQKKVKVAEEPVEAPVEKKRKREVKKSNDPPEWFKKYVEGVQKEKAATGGDVSKKQETIIKNEALKVAQKSWDSGFTRDRVQNEVDSHMNRMYSMIFSR
jgi:outer membrane biosynthesis protein TonB